MFLLSFPFHCTFLTVLFDQPCFLKTWCGFHWNRFQGPPFCVKSHLWALGEVKHTGIWESSYLTFPIFCWLLLLWPGSGGHRNSWWQIDFCQRQQRKTGGAGSSCLLLCCPLPGTLVFCLDYPIPSNPPFKPYLCRLAMLETAWWGSGLDPQHQNRDREQNSLINHKELWKPKKKATKEGTVRSAPPLWFCSWDSFSYCGMKAVFYQDWTQSDTS